MIPAITVSEGKPTMFFPLLIVVSVSMVKDFFEDWKRRKSDQKENSSKIEVLTDLGFRETRWGDIYVGNLIKVYKDHYFPCDVLLLKHGDEAKLAYVQTKNFDGQTNLKLKKPPQALLFLQKQPQIELNSLQMEVMYEKPNPFIGSFNGNLKIGEVFIKDIQKKVALEPSNIVLRGCSLKINSYAIGLCLYNGHETKVMMNGSSASPKKSSLERSLNKYFQAICLLQVIVTVICSLTYGGIVSNNFQTLGQIVQSPNFGKDFVSAWGAWFISVSNLIPISLVVTVQMIRYGQGYLLNKDPKCSSKGFYAQVQTSSVNQQLGQIQYILSDKTGTLTQNLMEFKCLCVGARSYGNPDIVAHSDEINQNSIITDGMSVASRFGAVQEKAMKQMQAKKLIKNVDFDPQQKQRLLFDLNNQIKTQGNQSSQIQNTLLHLALCHNVIIQNGGYTSSSPDQLALVSFAKYIGYSFIEKNNNNQIIVAKGPNQIKYTHFYTLQFSSQRKRMSVIVKDPNGRLLLLTKGADDVIIQRSQSTQAEQAVLNDNLSFYAIKGLRTLVLAYRELSDQQFQEWRVKYEQALTIVGPERMQKIYEMQSIIQRQLILLGATAIQDKLQNQVKQTIQCLKSSGIKVWMLTGDKKQTAVSIGYSCGLINQNCQKITLDCEPEHAQLLIKNVESMLHMIKGDKVTIVSGQILRKMKDETLAKLANLLKMSSSVICCRVSPKDKQTLTTMVKQWGRTLAVGDGANDVNMINAANVGVGVKGIEGSQATRAADFVIGEFKILKRLVVFYGLNFYSRNSSVIIYNLYKNIAITFPLIAYGPLSIMSSTYIYETWIFQFYNLFFSSLPIFIFGLFDIKYNQKQLQQQPLLYRNGQNGIFFNRSKLLYLFSMTALSSAIMIYISFYTNETTLLGQGFMSYETWSGMLIFNTVVICVNVRIYTIANQISPILLICSILSVLSYYLVFLFVGVVMFTDCRNVFGNQLRNNVFWLLVIAQVFAFQGTDWTISKLATFSHQSQNAQKNKINEDMNRTPPRSLRTIDEESSEGGNSPLSNKSPISISPRKLKRDLSGTQNSGGYAFAEDEQRSMHVL